MAHHLWCEISDAPARTRNLLKYRRARHDVCPMPTPDRQFAEGLAKHNGLSIAKLGLRFDRVVIGIQEDIRAFAETTVQHGSTAIVTITAPIRLPAKTSEVVKGKICELVSANAPRRDKIATVHQNKVRIRFAQHDLMRATKSIVLVHNPDKDSKALIDMCAEWLLKGHS